MLKTTQESKREIPKTSINPATFFVNGLSVDGTHIHYPWLPASEDVFKDANGKYVTPDAQAAPHAGP